MQYGSCVHGREEAQRIKLEEKKRCSGGVMAETRIGYRSVDTREDV